MVDEVPDNQRLHDAILVKLCVEQLKQYLARYPHLELNRAELDPVLTRALCRCQEIIDGIHGA